MRRTPLRADLITVVVVLIAIELLKAIFVPNPIDVIVLGGLILVLILFYRKY